jgi:hypothetical protein
MSFLTRFLTFTMIGWVILQVAAKATTADLQEHNADAVCTASPVVCGLGDGSGAPMDF